MKVAKSQLREDIQALMNILLPFGIRTTEQLAILLRDNDSYPSGAYLRLMLSAREEPQPSERFCDRFYLLKEYVERSLVGEDTELLLTLDRILIKDDYDPGKKLRFITSNDGHLQLNEVVLIREVAGAPEGALVYVPPDFIGQCLECGDVFFKRSPVARYCGPDCRKQAARERRRQREADRAQERDHIDTLLAEVNM